ncbi:MAG: 2-amino-4-hydroxy-6-hydroxymethyldihydropteridine diphosphokinase [Marinobacter sp.]|uniref:2-amino-4-hydroxy-6- hydroxymethyldihydropteridine diphosphokinase n=1 Tax=Marinobacter sp. TaxID=50741 RepID=UPI00299DC84B|nr:2-amino-4-hydroxy-6-hydroxymethyldihydropteridine diphosphokinase [Marinobacter sp.]MDX1757628.1 2-amino-4-hydroxy-6-hydroxymethyldihydropteridine diphosphokinase [Marinobacter sp.]
MTVRAYVGLGSNLANPLQQLAAAVTALATLPQSQLVAQSPFYRSAPVGPQDQPDFINGAVALETRLPALALLDQLQAIEQSQGRQRIEHWGPRTLDLDLLLYGKETITCDRLRVPHPELVNRDFVLQPLLDLDPALTLPDGRALADLRPLCPDNRLQRLDPQPATPPQAD